MTDTPLFDDRFDAQESQRRSERGQERATRANAGASAQIADLILSHLKAIAPDAGSSDTFRAWLAEQGIELPTMTSPNVISGAFGKLSRAGLIVCVGVTRSTRISAHRAKIYTWKLAEHVHGERGQR